MRKITPEQFIVFNVDYLKGKFPNLHFGQAFYNAFNLTVDDFPTVHDDNRFYNEEEPRKIHAYVWANFIDCEVPELHNQNN